MMTPSPQPVVSSRRLVIVEDEAILALDIERHLTRLGFDVCGVAADSDSAMAMVEAERPDLVLMDIRLQGPRDGIETAAMLRERFDVPVVYLTAHGDPKTMERAQLTEPMGYLLKPFKKPDLQNVVSIALARGAHERRLRRREEALSVTLSCIGEAIVTTDQKGAVSYLNRAAEELTGRPNADAIDQPLAAVLGLRSVGGGPLDEEPVSAALRRGRVHFESTLAAPEGARSLAGTAATLKHGEQSFGVVLALRDLTDLLQARRQLEFAERLTSLGTLAAGVAHEVNNPLSVVISNLEFALQEELPPEVRDALAEASEGAQRVARIVGELRSLARPQSEALQLIEPGEVLGSALSFTRGTWRGVAGVVLDLQACPQVMAAPTRLAQVLVNLIINAVHAMQEVTGRPRVLTISTGTTARGDAELMVSDTGPGIPERLRERVFEPFFTTKPVGQGSGLGLAVSRSIVENQGGRLEIASGTAGLGTTFRVVLPEARRPWPEVRPLRVWWVGPACKESAQLSREAHCEVLQAAPDELRTRLTERAPEVALLGTLEAAPGVSGVLSELELHTLRVGDDEPAPGLLGIRLPIDVRSLTAFIRRGEPK